MSFRKRNVALSGTLAPHPKSDSDTLPAAIPGVRASPLDGRLTTSTGTSSLDDILGHSGFALGNSLLIEENGTTEFGTTLLRYFAAEGVVQGQEVHVVGVGDPWARDLPGVSIAACGDIVPLESLTGPEKERMKIAWRYERLGDFGAGQSSARGGTPHFAVYYGIQSPIATPAINRKPEIDSSNEKDPIPTTAFCHTFDLTKRLKISNPKSLNFIPIHLIKPQNESPFHSVLQCLRGLTRWMELLSDGIIELSPFPHSMDTGPSATLSGAATAQEETPQGMVKVHRLPVFSEKGGGGNSGDDLAFTVSRRKFVIKPFNLPPVEGDSVAQRGEGEGKPIKVNIEF
ncbi:MAG: hypothetical protein Q9211_006516 [Gyalolechia sp. 1 TL-2023]